MTAVNDLAAWLTQILDVEEALARAAARGEDDPGWTGSFHGTDGKVTTWRGEPVAMYADADDVAEYPLDVDVAKHISYNDPAKVLADVTAKRAIIAWCSERARVWVGRLGSDPSDPNNYVCGGRAQPEDSVVLRLLASAYADRPGYLDEWRP